MNVKFGRKRPIIKAKIGQQRKQYKKLLMNELLLNEWMLSFEDVTYNSVTHKITLVWI